MRKEAVILLCCILALMRAKSQHPAFFHLSTAEGLSDNYVNAAAIDRNGILWIGTSEGLSSFDGNRIQTFDIYRYPALADNNIEDIVIDNNNHIWIRTSTSYVSMLDEKRIFHLLKVGDSTNPNPVTSLFQTSKGVVAVKQGQHFIYSAAKKEFERMSFPSKKDLPSRINFIRSFSMDKMIYYSADRLYVADLNKNKIDFHLDIKGLTSAIAINNDELLAYPLSGEVFYRVSLSQQRIVKEYRGLLDQFNKPIEGNLRNIARINENLFAITSRFSGLYFLKLDTESLEHYVHDPLDQRSVGGNNTYKIMYDTSGYLMVTTQTSGLHYYNTNHQQASFKPYFKDGKAEVFDGYIQSITLAGNKVVMGAQDRLIRWDRVTDKTEFIPCFLPGGNKISNETFRVVHFDRSGNLWVGTSRFGILVLDKNDKTIHHFKFDSTAKGLPSLWINAICPDKNGNLWIGALNGVCRVKENGFEITRFEDHPVLKKISKVQCSEIFADDANRIWIGTTTGVYCYDESKNSLVHYTTKDGLPDQFIQTINQDNNGNIYFGTAKGLTIFYKNGEVRTYNRSNGLRNDKCEGILKDEKGMMWIGNLNCILRYDPIKKVFAVFEEGHGFSHSGFRMRSCYKSSSGEMFWGSDKGLIWFFPHKMETGLLTRRPFIHSLQSGDSVYFFDGKSSLEFPYRSASFAFYFSTGEIAGGNKVQVLYRLKGLEDDWKTTATSGQVVYSRLPPGDYEFEIKASRDGNTWQNATFPVLLTINKPWWNQAWFYLLMGVLTVSALYFIYRYYRKQKEDRIARLQSRMEIMELNVKMAESRFSNLRLQMNPHFLFNSLSAIQHLIISEQTTKAYKYLTVFSNFLRSLLNYADRNFIPLEEELKILRMYVELESLRFDQSFSYEISVDEGLANEEVLLPTLMIQPFAENAIWHGLLHKEGEKKLAIRFSNASDEYLTCTIEDNGIGRKRSADIKRGRMNSVTHISKGIGIIKERLNLMQQKTGKPATVDITDVFDQPGNPAGTKVTITIPYYNPESND